MRSVVRLGIAAALVAAVGGGVAEAASPVGGSFAGPITSVAGSTFVVRTSLSPTGRSKVHVGAKTAITEQVAGTSASLKTGECVVATGTKKGATIDAQRVLVRSGAGASCASPLGGRRIGNGTRPRIGSGNGFRPPANFAIASGSIASIHGTQLTVKSSRGTTKVVLAKSTPVERTISVASSGIKKALCAFVRGTSSDKGVTVTAQSVALSKPVAGSCNARRPGPRTG